MHVCMFAYVSTGTCVPSCPHAMMCMCGGPRTTLYVASHLHLFWGRISCWPLGTVLAQQLPILSLLPSLLKEHWDYKHTVSNLGGGRVYFVLQSITKGSQNRVPAEPKAETSDECCFLTCSLRFLPGPLAQGATAHNGLDSPALAINQKITP